MSWYRQQLEDWLKELDVTADVVYDIGGKQLPVKGRTKSWDVKEYEILDLPDFDIQQDDYPYGISSEAKDREGVANIIFMLEVAEYLTSPQVALNNVGLMLGEGGKAYITFALSYPVHEEVAKDSLRYTLNGIHRLAEVAGLKITAVRTRHDKSGLLKAFYAADGMHPAKGWDHSVTGYICEMVKS